MPPRMMPEAAKTSARKLSPHSGRERQLSEQFTCRVEDTLSLRELPPATASAARQPAAQALTGWLGGEAPLQEACGNTHLFRHRDGRGGAFCVREAGG